MVHLDEDELFQTLSSVLLLVSEPEDDTIAESSIHTLVQHKRVLVDGLDEDLVHYMAGLLSAGLASDQDDHHHHYETHSPHMVDRSQVDELLHPFLESVQCPEQVMEQATTAVWNLVNNTTSSTTASTSTSTSTRGGVEHDENGMHTSGTAPTTTTTLRRLPQGVVRMSCDLAPNKNNDTTTNNNHNNDQTTSLWSAGSGDTAQTLKMAMANNYMDAHTSKSSAKDRRKQRQELSKARREYQDQMKQNDENDANDTMASTSVVSTMVLPDYTSGRNERDIQVRNVSLSLDNGRSLLDHGELKLAYQRRYGLVGKNGVGKTTLLKAIASMEIEGFPRHLRVLHVRQELKTVKSNDTTSVVQAVLQADVERLALLREEQELLVRLEGTRNNSSSSTRGDGGDKESISVKARRERLLQKQQDDAVASTTAAEDSAFHQDLKRLDQVYARLQLLSADSAEARAAMILSGLQFTREMQEGPTSALSGGWRMRVALAAALFIEPDLLMLDEPTNHLSSNFTWLVTCNDFCTVHTVLDMQKDLEAVLWLESYLVDYKHTLIVVSHDRSFLNEVCTDIVEFQKLKLTYYRGNYDSYVKTAEEKVKNTMRVYQAYQDKRSHLMEFIEKFRANAKRASMVQSRIKTVEKMDAEAPEPIEAEQVWRFSIPNPEPLGRPIISIDDVTFDYNPVAADGTKKPQGAYLLQTVNFGVDLSSRIGVLGANGAGKSTLLNLILGLLEPKKGSVSRNGRLRIGHFTQHSADKFDLQLSSVENMLNVFENAEDQEMRSFLGKFQIQGVDAIKPMAMLSGGQKSRVAFATLAYQKPHVIVMDEPTNHLDMESIDALVAAVKDYRGGLMVVSHDQFFITNTCRELWVVGEGHATQFRGTFDEYKKETLERTRKRVEASVKSLSAINN